MHTSAEKSEKAKQADPTNQQRPEPNQGAERNGLDPMLYWQNTIGNKAAQRLLIAQAGGSDSRSILQRAPEGAGEGVKTAGAEEQAAALKRPAFFTVSPTKPIPGDPVAEAAGWQEPYTDQNRRVLLDALLKRNEANSENGMKFISRFSSAFLKIWSGYAIKEMAKAATPDTSFLGQLAKLATNAMFVAILAVPVLGELEEAGIVISEAAEEGFKITTEVSLHMMTENQQEKKAEGKVEQKEEELDKETEGLADQFSEALVAAIRPLTTGFYYTQWLEEAILEDLPMFRLPPLIPDKSIAEIEAVVAGIIGTFFNLEPDVDEDKKSLIRIELGAAPAGWTSVEKTPTYSGPRFLGQRLLGQLIALMPNMPLSVNINSDLNFALADIVRKNGDFDPAEMSAFKTMSTAWPDKAPMNIMRDDSGEIKWINGGMAEMLYLYQTARPDENLYPVLHKYIQNMDEPVERFHYIEEPQESFMGEPLVDKAEEPPEVELEPSYTRESAALALWQYLMPGVDEGVKKLIQEDVTRMPVGDVSK